MNIDTIKAIVVAAYVLIGLYFAVIQDYDEGKPKAYNLLKGLFIGFFRPIIAIVFFVEDIK